MSGLPKILRHTTFLANWSKYPLGSVERAKALGIELFSQSNNLDATIKLWKTECDLVDKEKPWEPLGLQNKEQYILAVTGKSEKQIEARISKTQAIRARRQKHPAETLQETATETGVSRQFVHQVLSSNAFESKPLLDNPEWIKSTSDKATFQKLSKPDQEKVRKAGKGSLRGIAITAGVVKVPSVLEQLNRLWKKATQAERDQFLSEVACP